jgi:hypothetical protein
VQRPPLDEALREVPRGGEHHQAMTEKAAGAPRLPSNPPSSVEQAKMTRRPFRVTALNAS